MIDTIELRFHGCLDRKNDSLTDVRNSNGLGVEYAVQEHHDLYKALLVHEGKFFNMVQRYDRETTMVTAESDSDFLHQENSKPIGFQYVKSIMRFTDQSVVRETIGATNGRWQPPSSVASVIFKINHNAGFIDFNFSIPKYLYGHSLAEFIPQVNSNSYRMNTDKLNGIGFQRKVIFERLNKFLDKFLLDISKMFQLEIIPNKNYIEVRRIDLCYNQHFENKSDAINYLEHQKKIVKKKSNHSKNKVTVYDSSFAYTTTSGGYFKVYHKGTEYVNSKSGDFARHLEYNKMYLDEYFGKQYNKLVKKGLDKRDIEEENDKIVRRYIAGRNVQDFVPDTSTRELVLALFENKVRGEPVIVDEKLKNVVNVTAKRIREIMPFKTEFLKSEMDKVLRYEISLRGDFFSYQYKNHVFRNKPFRMKNENGVFESHDFCREYRNLQENYKYVHSFYHSPIKNIKKIKKFEHDEYKVMNEFYSRKVCLTLSTNPIHEWVIKSTNYAVSKVKNLTNVSMIQYNYTMLRDKDVGIFCEDFLQRCFDYFFRIVKEFQLDKLETFDTVAEKIKAHNFTVERNVAVYNEINHFKTKDRKGENLRKGNLFITKATQLLTQKEKRDLKLKKIDPLRLTQIIREMERGLSLHQIRDKLNIEKSTFSRLKSDLGLFGIFEETLEMEKEILVQLNFKEYYFKSKGWKYQNQFFIKENHLKYG